MTERQEIWEDKTTDRVGQVVEENPSANQSPAGPMTLPRVPQPIFVIVNAPLIVDLSRDTLLESLRLRKEYVAVTEARCQSANEDVRAVIRSAQNSFNESLLETMSETRWDVDIEDLTDDFLMTKILEIMASFKNRELPDMEDLFSDDKVTAYFHLANEIIKRNGVTDLFLEGERLKRKCKVLVKFLPGPLSTKVKNELENRGEAKASVRKLYRVTSNLALDLEKETRALRRATGKSVKSGKRFSAKGSTKVSSKKPASIVSMTTGPSPWP
ncbi:Cleavage induced Hypothetical protein [Phytophthora palmivora]|uniref:Uncharacterized protein n=1 Tax=Phytophthora palmivora TaxID=4796 RepID=A0A2P4X456_9STRA|nr:Cleavage induced Hypothetical protein [Phytophthora palmivora]